MTNDTTHMHDAHSARTSTPSQQERREMNQLLGLSLFLMATSGLLLFTIPSLRSDWIPQAMLVTGFAAGSFAFWVKCRF